MTTMRISMKMAVPMLGSLVLLSACGPGYGTTVGMGLQTSSSLSIYGYSADQYGDWHTGYRQWQPATVYEVNGQYYPNKVNGARQVQVYHSQTGYFMPPRDAEWAKTDKRFDQKKIPNDADYGRARPRP
jgi:hypothetical protein